MADALTNITNFVNSPPGQLAAGAVLAGIVWKFFERVEGLLTEQTKFEIAVWLVGVQVGQKVEPWPETFAKLFDRVFGKKHLSWRCFGRSCLASYASVVLVLLLTFSSPFSRAAVKIAVGDYETLLGMLVMSLIANAIPDYISLLKTRQLLRIASKLSSTFQIFVIIGLDLVGTILSGVIGVAFSSALVWIVLLPTSMRSSQTLGSFIAGSVLDLHEFDIQNFSATVYFYPAFFTSIWLWLYAGSGFLLKAARRFDIGFQWFNRKFDIEKKWTCPHF